jgi:nucleotide-binding universal stress UspA family protein
MTAYSLEWPSSWHEVCELAKRAGVDLIAIWAGGRDQPGEGPKHLGPTARFVSDHSPCPVLLVREGRSKG